MQAFCFVDGNISADAYSENSGASCGASGGTVILNANEVSHWKLCPCLKAPAQTAFFATIIPKPA